MKEPSLLDFSGSIADRIVAWRRDIHAHPEVGFEVHRTAGLVAKELRALGFDVREGVGRTGVVGTLKTPRARHMIALRADMDALEMEEKSGVAFSSKVPGRMHACGHDANTAMLLGTATILAHFRARLKASVRLLFQPSEEKLPGGAKGMVDDGSLDGVTEVYGLHLDAEEKAGLIIVRPGPVLAAADAFRVIIRGVGGHGAQPHLCADPVCASAAVIQALQTIVSRRVDPVKAMVISVCTIHGGSAFNIIPAEVELGGTVRTLDSAVRERVIELMSKVAGDAAASCGCTAEVQYERGYPVLTNSVKHTAFVREQAVALLGSDALGEEPPVRMGGEDFAYFVERVPGVMISLGARPLASKTPKIHHSADFDIEESILHVGSALMAQLVMASRD